MNWLKRLSAFGSSSEPKAPTAPKAAAQKSRMKISDAAVSQLAGQPAVFMLTSIKAAPKVDNPYAPAEPPPGLNVPSMAKDEALSPSLTAVASLNFDEGIGFLGYPYLAELAQRPEYRRISETLAKEMTREWIEFTSEGEEDNTERLKDIATEFDRLRVQDHFRRAIELDGFFGRGQIYIDTGATDKPEELKTKLILDRRKIRKGAKVRLVVVEPLWTYPSGFNSTDPLRADYYKPQHWYVMTKQVHVSRILTFVGREVPDILKPAYSFGGLSLSQMAKPYVDNWLRTRQSVSDLLHSFTVFGLKTDMSGILSGDGAETLIRRAEIFNRTRDNRGVMMINKGDGADPGEDLTNVSAPLGTLDHLQNQSIEQMAFVSATPLVKLLGTTPSGLNASSDGEIRVYYDSIAAFQEQMFKAPLELLLKIVQLVLFGEIDPAIGFEFKPLWQQDEAAQAVARKADADTDVGYVNAGVLDPIEVRRKLAADKNSPYASLDVDDVPEPPEEDAGGEHEDDDQVEEEPGERPFAGDADWKEGDHPRRNDGKFGSGGGEAAYFTPEKVALLPHPTRVYSPARSWEEAESLGKVGRDQFGKMLGEVAAKMNLSSELASPLDLTSAHVGDGKSYLFLAPNKSEARAKDKVANDYDGDWTRLKDVIRATIAVESVDDVREAVQQLEAAGVKLAAKPKDNMTNPKPEGYRDLNLLVMLPNGMPAELQINVKSMIAAKEAAHHYYEVSQSLERRNGGGPPDATWSKEDRAQWDEMAAKQKGVYEPAWKDAGGEA